MADELKGCRVSSGERASDSRSDVVHGARTAAESVRFDCKLLQYPDVEVAQGRVVLPVFRDVSLMFEAAAR